MSASFWKGAFLPVQKHITSIGFIPIQEMTQENWNILDYDELRPGPKNRIANAIVDGTLLGFYEMNVDMHKVHTPHGGKPKYFWPAIAIDPDVREPAPFDKEVDPDFGPSPDDDIDIEPSRPSQRMDDLMFWLKVYATAEVARIIMEKLAAEKQVPYEEFDNSFELLELRHQLLILAIGLFATNPARAIAILKSVDILDEEVYAALNDEEPTE